LLSLRLLFSFPLTSPLTWEVSLVSHSPSRSLTYRLANCRKKHRGTSVSLR
jgi:hypothetical protein